MIAFVFFVAGLLVALRYAHNDRRNREWRFDAERESLRRGMQVEPFTGRTR